MLSKVINYYTDRGSHVFAFFVDLTRAFDRVNYWKLFNQLLSDGVDVHLVKLLAYWYVNQEVSVRWLGTISESFYVGNGTKQGEVLSKVVCNNFPCFSADGKQFQFVTEFKYLGHVIFSIAQ